MRKRREGETGRERAKQDDKKTKRGRNRTMRKRRKGETGRCENEERAKQDDEKKKLGHTEHQVSQAGKEDVFLQTGSLHHVFRSTKRTTSIAKTELIGSAEENTQRFKLLVFYKDSTIKSTCKVQADVFAP